MRARCLRGRSTGAVRSENLDPAVDDLMTAPTKNLHVRARVVERVTVAVVSVAPRFAAAFARAEREQPLSLFVPRVNVGHMSPHKCAEVGHGQKPRPDK